MQLFTSKEPFLLERGGVLPEITISYHTYGALNPQKDNVVWICHALTANSDPMQWWPAFTANNASVNQKEHFIICANILGSCYGTTGPLSIDPVTNAPWYESFPLITMRDIVKAHQLLAEHLGINKIALLIGGSMGGYQALEWSLMDENFIDKMFLLATAATESPWRIAIHTAQRLSIEADQTWGTPHADAGKKGLIAARAIGMITYRSNHTYEKMQIDTDNSKVDDFKAASYINYQGNKLAARFNAYSYWFLTKAMDSHNIARGREDVKSVLQSIRQKTLVMGISSDVLCPFSEQKLLADNIPGATLIRIDSDYGHDGFLVEGAEIAEILKKWMDI